MLFLRIFVDIVILIGIFLFPAWIFIILSLIGVFYFHRYYEILLVGLMVDSLYNSHILFSGFFYTITSILIFLISFEIKKRLKFY
ncbi:hypothetical protein EXS61_00300 [Candidatus Parcubacteria bacterium]|nr:hypothetical protein [Candidatus Parcubacteria bacterium]